MLFRPYKKYILTAQINCISNWIFLPFARLLGKEIYVWNHGWYGKENFWSRVVKKMYYFPINGFFLYGNYALNLMIKQGYDPNRLFVVYNSINYSKALDLRKSLISTNIYKDYFQNNYPVLVFSGRLQPIKKIDMLIRFLEFKKNQNIFFNLVLIGDGVEKERLYDFSRICGIESQVWFYGTCYDDVVLSELIFNADLTVSPGNVGLTAIQSLSFGTPVITNNDFNKQMPEFESITSGITGDFFKVDDLQSMTYTIDKWFSIYPQKTQKLVNSCFEIIDAKYNPIFQVSVMKKALNIT